METEILEKTRVIAEFMGWVQSTSNPHLMKSAFNVGDDVFYKFPFPYGIPEGKFYIPTPKFGCRLSGMHYHQSFDWLMPVVKRINDLSGGRLSENILNLHTALILTDKEKLFNTAYECICELREFGVNEMLETLNLPTKTITAEELEYGHEEYICASMFLDNEGIPTHDPDGEEKFSLVGRIQYAIGKAQGF